MRTWAGPCQIVRSPGLQRRDSLGQASLGEGRKGTGAGETVSAKASPRHMSFMSRATAPVYPPLPPGPNNQPPPRPWGTANHWCYQGTLVSPCVGFIQPCPQLCKYPLLKLSPVTPSERVICSPPAPRPPSLTILSHLLHHEKEKDANLARAHIEPGTQPVSPHSILMRVLWCKRPGSLSEQRGPRHRPVRGWSEMTAPFPFTLRRIFSSRRFLRVKQRD